jgi:rubrerythrin
VSLTLLEGFQLPDAHPLAGREAYQCSVCEGISYPPDPDKGCPYCNEDDGE